MNEPISVIEKNALDELRVEFGEYKGYRFLSVRTYSEFDGSKEKRPTKKGITVKPGQIRELIEALEAAETAAYESGLLERREVEEEVSA